MSFKLIFVASRSFELRRNTLYGPNFFVFNPALDERPEDCAVEADKIYCINILVSTGTGKV